MKRSFKTIGNIIQITLTVIVPGVIMFIIGIIPKFELENEFDFLINGIIIPSLLFYLSYIFTIIMHELGHLVMGIKNRGSLIEYNFLFFSICKEKKKTKLKFSGFTSEINGMCIMEFPQDITKSEYQKFCIGGPCVNFILLLISLYMIFMNLGFGLSNIIPFETITGMETDGMKLYRMKSEKNYIENINKKIKIQEFLKNGGEFRNIPNNLIYKPNNISNKSDMEMMIYYISKIIEQKKFEEAKKLIDECLNNNHNKMTAISKNDLKLSLIDIYLETNDIEEIKKTYDKSLFKYVEMISRFEKSVIVYLYLYYIINDNTDKANSIKLELEKYYSNSNPKQALVKESVKKYNLINEIFKIK